VPAKTRYYAKDLQDWARFYGLKIIQPSVFPVNSVKSLRGTLVALEHKAVSPYSYKVFAAYWRDDQDISKDEVLKPIVAETGIDLEEYFSKINRQEYKDRIRANTDECIERGGFGSPTLFVNGSMFFGNDRLVLVEEELRRRS
jgi:2-hydroxychromene-2-carboxylate isomerase